MVMIGRMRITKVTVMEVLIISVGTTRGRPVIMDFMTLGSTHIMLHGIIPRGIMVRGACIVAPITIIGAIVLLISGWQTVTQTGMLA